MPRYKTRGSNRRARERKRIRAQIPRDKRKLRRWAVRGTHADYEKLRNAAAKHEADKPSYISNKAYRMLMNAERSTMIEAAGAKENHWFLDGLAWIIDKVPFGGWVKTLGQAALKPFRGDSMTEVDEQYARLLDQAYKDERAAEFEHWERQPEFDSNYITVYDNQDGHRYVAVRGTKADWQDVKQDVRIGLSGGSANLIGDELKRVLDHTEPGRHVDVGGHSLGTNLILTAYDHDDSLQNRVHETYLYNPTYTQKHYRKVRKGRPRSLLHRPARPRQRRGPGQHGPEERSLPLRVQGARAARHPQAHAVGRRHRAARARRKTASRTLKRRRG